MKKFLLVLTMASAMLTMTGVMFTIVYATMIAGGEQPQGCG